MKLTNLLLFLACTLMVLQASAQEAKLPFSVPKNASNLPRGATIETDKGAIEISFFRDVAPLSVASFCYLADQGFYKNIAFHRHVPGFVIQGGDPTGTGKGGPGYHVPPEFSGLEHNVGTVGMARLNENINPERLSNGSQFYITLSRARHLDGLYTVFAEVTKGIDIARALRVGDRILTVKVHD